MAAIRKVRRGTYQFTVSCGYDVDGKIKQVFKTYHCKRKSEKAQEKEAYSAAVEFEKSVKQGWVMPSDVRFYQFYETWRKEWGDPVHGHLTLCAFQNYCDNINRWIIPEIGNKKLQEIVPNDIQHIINELNIGHAPATVHKIMSSLDSVLRYAYKMCVIEENPLKRCELPSTKKEEKEIHTFTSEQAITFLNAITKPYPVEYNRKGTHYTELKTMPIQLQAFFYLAIYGGFRRGEILALTWHDIDMSENTVSISKALMVVRENGHLSQRIKPPKTAHGVRVITVPQSCIDILSRWKLEERKLAFKLGSEWQGADNFDEQFIFIQQNGLQMNATTPRLAFHRFIDNYNQHCTREKDKLPKIRLHDLRHTTATLLFEYGADVTQVQNRLGHAKASTTLNYYAETIPERDKQASDLLEKNLHQA